MPKFILTTDRKKPITITEKEFDKVVADIAHEIITSGGTSTDKIIASTLFSFAVFDQLYYNYSKKHTDVLMKESEE